VRNQTRDELIEARDAIKILVHALEHYSKLPDLLYVPEWKDYVSGHKAQDAIDFVVAHNHVEIRK